MGFFVHLLHNTKLQGSLGRLSAMTLTRRCSNTLCCVTNSGCLNARPHSPARHDGYRDMGVGLEKHRTSNEPQGRPITCSLIHIGVTQSRLQMSIRSPAISRQRPVVAATK